MQFEERLSEAGGEGGCGFGDAAFRTGKFGGEAAQEIVLCLFGCEDADGRQYAEGIG